MKRTLLWLGVVAAVGLSFTLGLVALMVGGVFQQPPTGCVTDTTVPVGDTTGTPVEVAAKAALTRWTGRDAVVAVAVAGAESGWDPAAENPESTAKGLWQTMMSIHGADGTAPKYQPGESWSDPYANARVAHIIWTEAGGTFSGPWVAYDSGAYRTHLAVAEAAVAAVSEPTVVSAGAVIGPGPDGVGPEAQAAAEFIRAEWGFTGTIGGYGTRPGPTFHDDGLAIDVMLDATDPTERAMGDAIAAYFTGTGAQSFGVNNVIWNRQITNSGRGWVWGLYTGASPHTDHVHIDFHPGGGDGGGGGVVDAAAECPVPTATTGDVVWPVDPATDSENYGGYGAMWEDGHTGTDFDVACGTPVKAAHTGTVQVTLDQEWAGPWLVKITTGPDALTTWYAHMQQIDVAHGQQVTAGQVIGEVGSEGNSTGCHLHFEVHPVNGSIYEDDTDPSVWLQDNAGQAPDVQTVAAPTGGGEVIASWNVLGSSHTTGNRKGFASGVQRIRQVPTVLNSLGVTLAGLQEFQPDQREEFNRVATGWRMWRPTATGASSHNAIVWRTDRWSLVRGASVTVPNFLGQPIPQPVGLMRHVSGVEVWVMNVHNAPHRAYPTQHYRDEAVRRQLAMIDATGGSWLLMGDMNDYDKFYCRAASAGLQAPNGGNVSPCTPPQPRTIDWIMGTPDVGFSDYARFKPPGRISDHPIVTVTIH